MMNRLRFFSLLLLFSLLININSRAARAEVSIKTNSTGFKVLVDGKLFTEYLMKSGTKPILWPINGPDGQKMTRSYPMVGKKMADERQDHPHHRSLWFTHGDVNGISFWHENNRHGTIVHKGYGAKSNIANTVTTLNDWIGPDGKKVCSDRRVFTFGANKDSRWIDFTVTLIASEGPVKLGDTKEGSFGIRVAGSMKVDAKKGGVIVNSNGEKDKKAWGKRAHWVDFNGPVDGKTAGIAILEHPSSYGSPTYWHARTYGLFAANPFGVKAFTNKKKPSGAVTLEKGKTLTLRYRVLFHNGNEKDAKVAEAYKAYAKQGSK